MQKLQAMADSVIPCKCCGGESRLYGVVDFHKNCEEARRKVLELSGIPVYYHRCRACGFLFTTAFDRFTHGDFATWIYNTDYRQVDPDYDHVRPQNNAMLVSTLLGREKGLRLLDYGCGDGKLATALRETGFTHVTCYDPFVPGMDERPVGTFDCIVSFEVVEHSPDPRKTLSDILSILAEPGIVLFSTLFQPPEIERIGLNWWYVGPRNGHVSIFSQQSMELLARSLGYRLYSCNHALHVLVREIPPFAAHWFRA